MCFDVRQQTPFGKHVANPSSACTLCLCPAHPLYTEGISGARVNILSSPVPCTGDSMDAENELFANMLQIYPLPAPSACALHNPCTGDSIDVQNDLLRPCYTLCLCPAPLPCTGAAIETFNACVPCPPPPCTGGPLMTAALRQCGHRPGSSWPQSGA